MVFFYVLLCYGITNIVVYGSIFKPFRDLLQKLRLGLLYDLFSCPICFSTWVGFILSYVLLITNNPTPVTEFFSFENVYLIVFLNGCFTSGTVWLVNVIENCLTKDKEGEDKEDEVDEE